MGELESIERLKLMSLVWQKYDIMSSLYFGRRGRHGFKFTQTADGQRTGLPRL